MLSVDNLKVKTRAVEAAVLPARTALLDMQDRSLKLSKELGELPELVELMKAEMSAITNERDMYDMRLCNVEGIASNGRQLALHKAFTEHEALRMEVAAKLRICIEAQGGKPEDLFEAISPNGSVDKEDIRIFLENNQCAIEPSKLARVFAAADAEADAEEADAEALKGAGEKRKKGPLISKEDFLRAIRIFYKVIKEIVLSDNLLIEQSRQIRRMEVGEVMEVHQGPMLDPSVGVYRVFGKVLRDGISGWVTVAGNQGVTFMLPFGSVFQVVRSVPLTEDLKDTEGTTTVRLLKEGQVLEVLEWSRTSRSALGVTRVKVKVQGDDAAVGWATTVDSDGSVYLEAT